MKKKKWLLGLFIVLILAIALSLAFYFTRSPETGEYAIYFSNTEHTGLKAQLYDIESASSEEVLNRALEILLLGPEESSDAVAVIPKGTQLNSVSLDKNSVLLDFSDEFLNNSDDVDKLLARYSVVKTVCGLSDAFMYVRLSVNGEPLYDNYGNELGLMSADDTLFDAVSLEQKQTKVILYFADKNGDNLVAEEREITVSEAEPLAMATLNELIAGPAKSSLVRTLPAETKVYSAEVKDRVCYANFSADLIQKHSGGSTAEVLTVYSIVNTLTALDGIDKVQFLIDGKIKDVFGSLILSDPFTSNIR